MDNAALELAQTMPGYLGHEVTGDGNEHSIFISYWKDMPAIENWKKNGLHKRAKAKGKSQWYKWYHYQICKVEQAIFHNLD